MHKRRGPLEIVGWLMVGLSVVFGAALVLDLRTIEGAPAWLKPVKFALSTGIYCFTLAWIFRYLPAWPRVQRIAGGATAVVFVIEVALIAVQAARGTTSHFNTSSLADGAIFGVMGVAIAAQTMAALMVAVALWRQPFADQSLGWALRLGMAISIAGASTGGLMTQPTTAQLELARTTGQLPRAGSHTVGGADGGPGLAGVGWSVEHGDLRVPHFVGLHAMQALPLAAIVLRRRRRDATGVRAVIAGGASYATLFLILFAQATLGQPLMVPEGAVRIALLVWAAGTSAFALSTWRATRSSEVRRTALETT